MAPRIWSQLTRTRPNPLSPPVGTAAEHLLAATLPVETELGSEFVRAAAQRDEWQIPAPEDREGYYGDNHANYWLSGLRDRQRALAWNSDAGNPLPRRVLEIGAASGRVIRHFAAQDPMCETWATDIDGQHVEWMTQHLGKRLMPVHTTILPSLPLADSSLDLVLAYSVLTHIDVLETAWLAEIRRVLRPGGLALVTVHTERSWELLEPGLGLYDSLLDLAGSISEIEVSEAMLAGPMPAPRIAMSWPTVADVYNSVVFHSREYIRDRWGRYFDVLDIIDEGSEYQAVVILRVPIFNPEKGNDWHSDHPRHIGVGPSPSLDVAYGFRSAQIGFDPDKCKIPTDVNLSSTRTARRSEFQRAGWSCCFCASVARFSAAPTTVVFANGAREP